MADGQAAEYAHPVETLILGLGTIGGPFLYCLFRQDLHILTVYIWISLRLFQAVDAHSGYDFPWSLRHFMPFWAGADLHDFHHQSFVNCYATSFRWWDRMCGTDNKVSSGDCAFDDASAFGYWSLTPSTMRSAIESRLRRSRTALLCRPESWKRWRRKD